ncbi:MAG: MiaB/RimO family radical SAM methylthiotransferase [Leptonema sp. (in: bacteria)]
MKPNFYITTLGCLKNEADSRDIYKSLILNGFINSGKLSDANFHIINTCGFIEEAKKETINTIFTAISFKKKLNIDQKLIVVGCFAERYKNEIKNEIPEVDLIIGTGKYNQIGEILRNEFNLSAKNLKTIDTYTFLNSIPYNKRFYLPIKISEGCNRNCSFCAIPNFKGKFFYKEKSEILKEIKEILKQNPHIREICLVSQDTNSYGENYLELINLIEEIEEIPEIKWIRLLYLYPDKKTEKILKEIYKKKFNKIVPYLESPVQHVSESILKKMNRFGNYSFFKDLFFFARELFPDLEIRTSFLVGFPEEKAQDIELIKKFINECEIEHISFFPYSREEGTSSFYFKNQITKKEIGRRVNELQNFYDEQLKKIMEKNLHKTFTCILEKITTKEMYFRRPQSSPEIDDVVIVNFNYKDFKENNIALPKLGNFYEIKINGFVAYDYLGNLVNDSIEFSNAKV